MGIANRIINILVLVSAIAVVIFGYMLFEKREKLVKGWGDMGNTINATAKVLDDNGNSGIALANDLNSKALDHKEYDPAKTAALLKKLDTEAKQIVKQRNELSENMAAIAKELEVAGENDSAELMKIAASDARQSEIKDKVKAVKARNDGVMEEVAKLSRVIDAEVAVADLKDNNKYKDAVAGISRKVSDINARSTQLQAHIKNVSDVLAIDSPSLEGDDFDRELKRTLTSVQSYRDEYKRTQDDLSKEKSLSSTLKEQIQKHENVIKNHLAEIDKQKKEIKRLVDIITPDDNTGAAQGEIKIAESNSKEILSLIRGEVVYVDKKYGFVTIDIGKKNQVVQKIGKIEKKIDAPLSVGEVMTSARNLSTSDAVFTGKLKVVKVNDNATIANVLPLSGSIKYPEIGDTVFFSDEDIEVFEAAKKKASEPSLLDLLKADQESNVEAAGAADGADADAFDDGDDLYDE